MEQQRTVVMQHQDELGPTYWAPAWSLEQPERLDPQAQGSTSSACRTLHDTKGKAPCQVWCHFRTKNQMLQAPAIACTSVLLCRGLEIACCLGMISGENLQLIFVLSLAVKMIHQLQATRSPHNALGLCIVGPSCTFLKIYGMNSPSLPTASRTKQIQWQMF